jgi:hypothetical protein
MISRIRRFVAGATTLTIIGFATGALAGPPMFTDDPGVTDKGGWEILVAASTAKTKAGDQASELPVVEIETAVTENIQLSAAYPYVFVDLADGQKGDDFGNLELAAKWRFFNNEKLQIAVVPTYLDGLNVTAATLGIGSGEPIRVLPVTAEYALGDWSIGGELAYASVKNEADEVAYGIIVGRSIGDRFNLMVEVYGATNSEFNDNFLNFNVGTEIVIAEGWELLLSLGSRITEPTGAEQLDYTGFVGIRHETGG